ncbi:nipped-B-like protein isoform X2 [Pezoporus wallicus]|uniref:nipped-B-like protein isoform X2 n=1 Tax=Pezoporus wallicus TaxID=35540 RepID=UPI002550F4C3|nr:nipped-B-like protein isoform X2 [Pezoporus wallicus]
MNGDMPHVPITTLAGIASLTDLLNQLPLPSPLPATTTKSLLFNGRIAEEVNCLLACRDENLVSQLIHSLNQVSTDHIELKDNLGSDDPEGDIPVLLQAILARNPHVFREKSMQNRYGVQSGMMMSQFNISQNSVRGSPASSSYQQTTISHSPSSRFVSPQTSSGNRFLAPQNSPVPSPYAPQSPAGYMPYSHPPSYTPHPQMQQTSVSGPIVTAGMRNLHENNVSSQLSGNSANHHADNSRHGSNEDYLQMVHRLSSDDGDPSIRNAASFSLRSPQSVCSPAGSDGALKDKPLKKRKQENKPQEAGGATGGNRAASQETGSAGNGARPALMVSIDLQQAGRVDSQATVTQDLNTIKKPEEIKQCNDGFVCVPQEDTVGVLRFNPENNPEIFRKTLDFEGQKMDIQQNENRQMEFQQNVSRQLESKHNEKQVEAKCESRQMEVKHNENRQTESKQNESRQMEMKQNEGKQNSGKQEIRQRPEILKQKSEGRPEMPKHRHDNRRDSSKSLSDKKIEIARHKLDVKSDPSRIKSESRSDPTRQRPDGRSVSDTLRHDHDTLKQRSEDRQESERYRGDPSKIRRPEYLRSSNKNERDSKHGIKSDGSKIEKFERKHRHESGESRERFSSGDHKSRPDSPRIKQEGKGDSSKSRPDKPGFKSPNSKDERRTDGNKSKVDTNKAHDSKAEFPSYLLGARSGALKHFVIPKIKRDKDGNVTQESRKTEFKGEQKDKIEKTLLVEDLNKGAKPVVVLQKLSLDDVQKFIKDREDKSRGSCFKPNKNKSSKSNKGKILFFLLHYILYTPVLLDLLLLWLEIKHKHLIVYMCAYMVILGNRVKLAYGIIIIGNLATV